MSSIKGRLVAIADQVKSNDEEYAIDTKFIGGRNADERVPQRYHSFIIAPFLLSPYPLPPPSPSLLPNSSFFYVVEEKIWNWKESWPLSMHAK